MTFTDSAAWYFLDSLRKKKSLSKFYMENLLGSYSYSYIQLIISGKKPPSMDFIMHISSVISPAMWFYAPDELPQDISFTATSPKDCTMSINFRTASSISSRKWCQEKGIPYLTVYALTTGRRSLTSVRIMYWKKHFPPELWFR